MNEMPNPDVVIEDRYILTGRVSAPELYIDGVSQLLLGVPVTKLILHTVINPSQDGKPEIRKAVAQLSMPTITAIELATLILGVSKKSEDHMIQSLEQEVLVKLKELLAKINTEVPAGFIKEG